MRNINRVMLIGNVGNDPETTPFDDGFKVTRFSLATTERWTDKRSGERQSKTEWHRVSIVNPKIIDAVFAQGYVKKGDAVMIEGMLRTSSYEKNGVKHYSTEIQVGVNGTFSILTDKKREASKPAAPVQTKQPAPAGAGPIDDDIPF